MLTQMVEMVRPLDTREYIWRLRPCSAFEDVPGETCARLQELMQQVGVSRTWRERDAVIFETAGALDTRWGLQYCAGGDTLRCAERRQGWIIGNWYVWTAE